LGGGGGGGNSINVRNYDLIFGTWQNDLYVNNTVTLLLKATRMQVTG
jgi:hypothetical protein